MEFLIILLLCLSYLAILIYPVIGLILIIDAISMYIQKGHPSAYYGDLEKFALMCVGYILGHLLFLNVLDHTHLGNFYEILFMLYFFCAPIVVIGKYQRSIRHKDYFKPIEKLIL